MKSVLPYASGLNLNSPNNWPKICLSNTQEGNSFRSLCDGTFNLLDFDIYGMPRYSGKGGSSNQYNFYFIWLRFNIFLPFPAQGRWGIVRDNPDPFTSPAGCFYIGPIQNIGFPPLGIPTTYLNYPRLVYTGAFQYCDIASGPCP